MSEPGNTLSGHAVVTTGAGSLRDSQSTAEPELTAGALLRGAREAAGLHIAALAALLKVPEKKLEALEQDRFDVLPDTVFARALAASVCRTLKFDATPVLERLPQIRASGLGRVGAGINTPFRAPGRDPGLSLGSQVSRPAVLVGLAFLLGGLVLLLLPAVNPGTGSGRADADGALALVGRPEVPGAMASDGAPVAEGFASATAPESSTPTLAVAPDLAAGAVAVPASALENSSTALTGALPAAATGGPAQPAGIVVFHATGESWVEVTDAKGVVVLRRILAAGELAGASGALPLNVVVGKADVTRVRVRGQAFDLGKVARNNVARFEVK